MFQNLILGKQPALPHGSSAWQSTYCRTRQSSLLLRRRYAPASCSDSEFSVLHSIQLCWHHSSVRWQFTPCSRIQSQRLDCILSSSTKTVIEAREWDHTVWWWEMDAVMQGKAGTKAEDIAVIHKGWEGWCEELSHMWRYISLVLCWRDICLAVTSKTSVISADCTLLLKKWSLGFLFGSGSQMELSAGDCLRFVLVLGVWCAWSEKHRVRESSAKKPEENRGLFSPSFVWPWEPESYFHSFRRHRLLHYSGWAFNTKTDSQ